MFKRTHLKSRWDLLFIPAGWLKLAGGVSHRIFDKDDPAAPAGAAERWHHHKYRSSYSTPLRFRSSTYSS